MTMPNIEPKALIGENTIIDRVKLRAANRQMHLSSLSTRRLDVVAEHESENEHSQKDHMKDGQNRKKR